MKIIDAHLHFWPGNGYFHDVAQAAGQENTEAYVLAQYALHGYVSGVVMGNHGLTLEEHCYPACLRYCIGISFHEKNPPQREEMLALAEAHLCRAQCVGIKLYTGYDAIYLHDPAFEPFLALAKRQGKPVAIHMGLTSNARAYLKYAHPLTLDEVAVRHPDIQFVMCHFGNPWLADAAAVLMKNPNVSADLSGLFEGRLDVPAMLAGETGPGRYLGYLRTWLSFVGDYRKFLYGTDWPLVRLGEYARLIAALIPEAHREDVFFHNANRIYGMGL